MYSMNWYHFVLYQSITLTNHSCRRFSTAILPIITQEYTLRKCTHARTRTHTHKAKPSAAGMPSGQYWGTCAPLRCYGSAQACPPGAGLVTHMRLYHVSQVSEHLKSHLDLQLLYETWIVEQLLPQLTPGTY